MKKVLLGTATAAALTALGTVPSSADGCCYRHYYQCCRPCVSYYSYPRVVYYSRPRVVEYYTYRRVEYDTYRRVVYDTYPRSAYDDR
jgi:hypothetical protein